MFLILSQVKHPCPTWQGWSEWSHCSTTCGKGVNIRSRACTDQSRTDHGSCQGKGTETKVCHQPECGGITIQWQDSGEKSGWAWWQWIKAKCDWDFQQYPKRLKLSCAGGKVNGAKGKTGGYYTSYNRAKGKKLTREEGNKGDYVVWAPHRYPQLLPV